MLDQIHKQIESAGISKVSGMHEPDVEEPPPLTPNTAAIIQRQPLDMFTKGIVAILRHFQYIFQKEIMLKLSQFIRNLVKDSIVQLWMNR